MTASIGSVDRQKDPKTQLHPANPNDEEPTLIASLTDLLHTLVLLSSRPSRAATTTPNFCCRCVRKATT